MVLWDVEIYVLFWLFLDIFVKSHIMRREHYLCRSTQGGRYMNKYTPYGVILTSMGGYTQYGVYTSVTNHIRKGQ